MYDFAFCRRIGSLTPALAAHHVLGLGLWSLLLAQDVGGSVALWVQLAEGSTPFLHLTTGLRVLDLASSALCKACGLCTLVTFFVLRCVLQPLCLRELLASRQLWADADTQLAFYATSATGVFFVALNLYWFSQMLAAAASVLRGVEEKTSSALEAAPAESECERKTRKRR